MSQLGMRPRFVVHLDEVDSDTSYAQIQKHVLSQPSDCIGMFRQRHMEIMFKPERRKYWSPQLSLEFEGDERKTSIRGLIAPQPGIWTMFMAGYFSLAILAFVGGALGYSQWTLQQPAWGFYLLAGSGAGMLLIYAMSLVGQRLALEQTIYLRTFLQESLHEFRDHINVGGD